MAILLGLGKPNTNIASLEPIDVGSVTNQSASVDEDYGLVLAVLSEMTKDKPATYPDLPTLCNTIATNIVGGALNNPVLTDYLAAITNWENNPRSQYVPRSLIATTSGFYVDASLGEGGGTLTCSSTNNNGFSVPANTSGTPMHYGMAITATGGTPPYNYPFGSF